MFALMCAAIYAAAGVIWIALSDTVVHHLFSGDMEVHVQTLKGWGFVIATTLVLYLSLRMYERKIGRAEQETYAAKEQLRLALEGTEEGVWDRSPAADDGGYWSNTMFALLGHEPGQISAEQRRTSEWVHPEDRPRVLAEFARHLGGETRMYACQFRARMRDGSFRWFAARGRVVARGTDGKPLRVLGTMRDIHEIKQIEQELVAARVMLEQRVRERTQDVEAANLALRQTNEDLQAFAYSVSHDLRAPLRAICGFAEIIQRRHAEAMAAEATHYVENIVSAGAQMSDLIEDLLKYSRLTRGNVQTQAIDPAEIISEVLVSLEPVIRESGGSVTIATPLPAVMADRTLLRQVIANLLENGLKYRRPGEAPVVEIGAQAGAAGIVLWVKDRGIGIAPEYHERLFRPFQRLHSQEEYPGTGIGLASVKRAVALMGGAVGLESAEGKGSTFEVTLPAA